VFSHLKFAVSKLRDGTSGKRGLRQYIKAITLSMISELKVPNSIQARTLPSRDIVRVGNDN
jgi:hypothetical protein